MNLFLFLVAGVAAYVYYKARHVPIPRRRWRRYRQARTQPMTQADCLAAQGIYVLSDGIPLLGKQAVIRYSYSGPEGRRRHWLSIFAEKEGLCCMLEGRCEGELILLSGHWRNLSGSGAGIIRLWGARPASGSTCWEGVWGHKQRKPRNPVRLRQVAPLPALPPFQIIAHRGGARNVDFLPYAENSLEMLLLAPQLGATGVEIDVRWTADDVPVLAHDSFLAFDSVRTPVFGGWLGTHKWNSLRRIRLRKGGRFPSLREALDLILEQTPLEFVWLDIKEARPLGSIQQLQHEIHRRAELLGRRIEVLIGIADKDILQHFQSLPDAGATPSLCELGPELAEQTSSAVWAPQYTSGPQPETVRRMQAKGHRVVVWSLDQPMLIEAYLSLSPFDGLVTNAAPVVAYWYYTRFQEVVRQGQADP